VTETAQNVTWLTQEAYDRLKTELEHLTGPGRVEIAKRIEAAREEGDLRENGGYHAAKEEQGKREARIRQLKALLEKARVGGAPTAHGVVAPGSQVTVKFVGDDDLMTFVLGSREAIDVNIEVYSPQSPLGASILGKKVGETATYSLPNGRKASVKITDAKPYTG
jgi:transcription elongation factor GreA